MYIIKTHCLKLSGINKILIRNPLHFNNVLILTICIRLLFIYFQLITTKAIEKQEN